MCFKQVQRFIWAKKYFGVRCTLSSFSLLKSLCKFSSKRYACLMPRADAFLKIEATKFNLEDGQDSDHFWMQSGQFGKTVLITMENKEGFWMRILTEALSLVTLHLSSPYGEPTSIVCSFVHFPGPCQRCHDLQRNTTSCYGHKES